MDRFPQIISIVLIMSIDKNFNDVVSSLGGTVSNPNFFTNKDRYFYVKEKMIDYHPIIDSQWKLFLPLTDDGNFEKNNKTQCTYVSPHDLILTNYPCWLIDNTTTVVGKDLQIMQGENSIIFNQNNLPEGVKIGKKKIGKATMPMLYSDNEEFFQNDVYKIVTMP